MAVLLLLTGSVRAETVTLNLKNTDITAVATTVAKMTGKNFLIDPRVKGKVTIISAHPMEKDELYDVFLSILEVHGFAAIDDGKVVKIIPNTLAKQRPISTTSDSSGKPGDEMVTQIVAIRNVQAQELAALLRPLVPQEAHIVHYAPSNIVIITDRAGNIQRLNSIIRRIDLASQDDIDVIALSNASATEVVRIINSLNQQQNKDAAPTRRYTVIADERTNSVLVSGDKATKLRIRTLIAHLDTPLVSGGNTQVIYLKYAKATELVDVLTRIAEHQSRAQGGQKTQQQLFNIQAHEATNALVITASSDQMRTLKQVIAQLDIRRAQVLVEAVIAEVSDNLATELGIQLRSTKGSDGSGAIGGSNFSGNVSGSGTSITGAAQDPFSLGDGLTLGFFEGTKTILGTEVLNISVLIKALSGDSSTNIISTPSLITMDNEEAEIVVAENVPFLTGQYTNTGTTTNTVNPFQTIERQDIGLILKVKPQINEGNAIKLEIEQEVSNISSSSSAVDLITNKRNIKTSVMAEDGQIIVLGGLIDDSLRQSQQKVPLLGDLPLLGALFRSNSTEKVKRNLMVFLRPVILRDTATTTNISHGKYDLLRAKQLEKREEGVLLMENQVTPVLRKKEEAFSKPTITESDDKPAPAEDETILPEDEY